MIEPNRQLFKLTPYSEYCRKKLLMDQNEKLVVFRVTQMGAIDGWSGKLVSLSITAIKNTHDNYQDVYRCASKFLRTVFCCITIFNIRQTTGLSFIRAFSCRTNWPATDKKQINQLLFTCQQH